MVRRGQELALRVIKIDIKERRLGLSLKSVNSTEYLDLDWEMAIEESVALPASEEAAEDSEETAEVSEQVAEASEEAAEDSKETAEASAD